MKLFERSKNYLKKVLVDWLFLKDLKTMDGISWNKLLYCHILPKIEEYNSKDLPLINLLCLKHDESACKFDTGQRKFERLAEGQMPKEKKIIWGRRQRDAEKFGHSVGYTWDWLLSEKNTLKNTVKILNQGILRDNALLTAFLLETCLISSVNGFYNGRFEESENMDRPPENEFKGISFKRDHNHYLALGRKELDQATLEEALGHIDHHFPWDTFLLFCNSDMKIKIKNFASRNKPRKEKINDEIIDGFIGKIVSKNDTEIFCFQLDWMPDDYFLFIATGSGGLRPLIFIQKKNPAAQGLILAPGGRPDYPIIDSAFIRFFSFRVAERNAGVVLYLGKEWKDPEITKNIIEYGY